MEFNSKKIPSTTMFEKDDGVITKEEYDHLERIYLTKYRINEKSRASYGFKGCRRD